MSEPDDDHHAPQPPRSHRGSLITLAALLLGAFALVWASDEDAAPPGARPVLISLGPELVRHQASERSGASCSLPVGRQVEAVRAFAEMMPVFRHPRCFNCHGGFDITSEEHDGSDFTRESGLDPRALLTAEERRRLHESCGSCHDNVRGTMTRLDGTVLAGWLVAPLPMLWDVSRPEELCMQLKRFERDGDQFIEHIQLDHNEIQFIEAAFNGDRALGPDGLADAGLSAEPPPGTLSQLITRAGRWVGAMGAEQGWVGDPPCGCVMPKLELTASMEITAMSGGGRSVSRMTATVPLTADSAGVYHGEAPLRPSEYELSPIGAGCTMRFTYTDGTFIVREARLDATDDGRTTVELRVQSTSPGGTMEHTCPNQPVPLVLPWMAGPWIALHQPDRVGMDYRFTEFETPAGASLSVGRTLVARKEVTRAVQPDVGGSVSARTIFELWAVPDSPE